MNRSINQMIDYPDKMTVMGVLPETKSWPEGNRLRWTDGGLLLSSIGWRLRSKDKIYILPWTTNHLCFHRESNPEPLDYNIASATT